MRVKIKSLFFLFLCWGLASCKKYLDAKSQQTLAIPNTLNDLQAILDNNVVVNQQASPALLEIASDDYFVPSDYIPYAPQDEQMNYIWDPKAFHPASWNKTYQGPIYYSNVVLNALPDIGKNYNNSNTWNFIKGAALFHRSFSFFQLAQIYCRPYSSTATTDLGIILKLSSRIDEPIIRSSVQKTYDQIIEDLKTSIDLLPASTSFPTQPNKTAAYALLSRVYLSMRDYENAGRYADLALNSNSNLMNYNSITGLIQRFNSETIYFHTPVSVDITNYDYASVDSTLYKSYDDSDLRKTIFFQPNGDGTYWFNGSYYGFGTPVFDGLSTDEMYLIRAECFARTGNVPKAMADLNTLMVTRWKAGTFTPFTAADSTSAKAIILTERRKELVHRGLRWSDIRRFNLEGANITLRRLINGTFYTLPPNDLRTVMLIPQQVINLSGIKQNPR